MKLQYNFFVALLLGVLFTSCDNFLDIQPTGEVIPTTASEYRELLTQAYSIVPSDRGKATFRSDEYVMDASLSKEDINSFKDIWSWNDDSPSENTSSFDWRSYYQVMFTANYTLESRNTITGGSQKEINQILGECYMLRAYMHFLLVNLYGEPYTACNPAVSKAIPLKLSSDTEKTLFRATVQEVYTQILSDIDDAEKLLNVDKWESGLTYRFNTLSVDALRSRVYLYMGRWNESLAASKRVLEKQNALDDLSTFLPNDFQSVEAIVSLEKNLSAQYHRAGKVNPDLFALYNSGDLRRSKYFKRVTMSNTQVLKGGEDKYRCTFRVGEIYLNAAEASLESAVDNNLGEARSYLLTLMKARYNSSYYAQREEAVNAMSRDELRQEIYNERFRELAFEGHRWFDLRRTTRPRIVKTYSTETYILNENDSRYTLRIPSEAVSANPELAN